MALTALLATGGCATGDAESRPPTGAEIARLDAWYGELLDTGPAEAGWDARGTDLPGLAGERRWLLLTDAAGRRQLLMPGFADEREVVPRSWRRLRQWREDGPRGERASLQVQPLDARHILVARGGYRRRGSAFCSDGGATLSLYERSAPASEFTRWEAETLAGYLFDRTRGRTLCARYDSIGGGQYAVRNFDGAGRPLATLDQAREIATIVPAAAVEALLFPDL
ncbi:MAG: hypothetical protein H7X93_03785 [Sphingomonadaceae bacterium]|nr:hypothetical protein [Sphingomonadaceae bacterium]